MAPGDKGLISAGGGVAADVGRDHAIVVQGLRVQVGEQHLVALDQSLVFDETAVVLIRAEFDPGAAGLIGLPLDERLERGAQGDPGAVPDDRRSDVCSGGAKMPALEGRAVATGIRRAHPVVVEGVLRQVLQPDFVLVHQLVDEQPVVVLEILVNAVLDKAVARFVRGPLDQGPIGRRGRLRPEDDTRRLVVGAGPGDEEAALPIGRVAVVVGRAHPVDIEGKGSESLERNLVVECQFILDHLTAVGDERKQGGGVVVEVGQSAAPQPALHQGAATIVITNITIVVVFGAAFAEADLQLIQLAVRLLSPQFEFAFQGETVAEVVSGRLPGLPPGAGQGAQLPVVQPGVLELDRGVVFAVDHVELHVVEFADVAQLVFAAVGMAGLDLGPQDAGVGVVVQEDGVGRLPGSVYHLAGFAGRGLVEVLLRPVAEVAITQVDLPARARAEVLEPQGAHQPGTRVVTGRGRGLVASAVAIVIIVIPVAIVATAGQVAVVRQLVFERFDQFLQAAPVGPQLQAAVLHLAVAQFVGRPVDGAGVVGGAQGDGSLGDLWGALVREHENVVLLGLGIGAASAGDSQRHGVFAGVLVHVHRVGFFAGASVAELPQVGLHPFGGLVGEGHLQRRDSLQRIGREVGVEARSDDGQQSVPDRGVRRPVVEKGALEAERRAGTDRGVGHNLEFQIKENAVGADRRIARGRADEHLGRLFRTDVQRTAVGSHSPARG